MVYEAAEDSYFLLKFVKDFASGKVLDMGSGSGIIAKECLKFTDDVTAADIDEESVKLLKKNFNGKVIQSDLWKNINEKYDTVFFNPPYLPEDKYNDIALDGGKEGYEVILRFLKDARHFLKPNGKIILLFSSLSNPDIIEAYMKKSFYDYKILGKLPLFFEELFVYLVQDSLKFLAKGKRSYVYEGYFRQKRCAFKFRNPKASADTLKKEFNILKELNKYSIGPKVYHFAGDFFIMEFAEGLRFNEFLIKSTREKILEVLNNILKQLRTLDKLGIDKKEMSHPYKHIIVGKKVYLIDFDRASKTQRPSNVTQFCSFLLRNDINKILAEKRIFVSGLKPLCKDYKSSYKDSDFNTIKDAILQKNLREKIYFVVSKIPKGKVTSYKDVANALGIKAYRFVGNVMHNNTFIGYVPCHRVVKADGTLGGFSKGVKKKKELLLKEGIKFDKKIPKKYFYDVVASSSLL